jgi:predicted ATPase
MSPAMPASSSSDGSFRLMRVELREGDDVRLDIDLAKSSTPGLWTTLITGRNGSGKSRLLSSIATCFAALDGVKPRPNLNASVQYQLEGSDCEIHVERGRVSAFLEGRVVDPSSLPRPGAVVAATASAFDKFPLPRTDGPFGKRDSESTLYKYLGLRDIRGRISTKAGLHRAIEQLFDANTDGLDHRMRVADVFSYLGYEPIVEVVYRWTTRGRELSSIGAPQITAEVVRDLLRGVNRPGIGTIRPEVPSYLFMDDYVLQDLASSAEEFRWLAKGREIRLVADYSSRAVRRGDPLRMARQLSRAGLVQMDDVVLTAAPDGHHVELAEASSGQLSLAMTLLGLASSIKEKSLVLIDEPEISLHPQWQIDYLSRLEGAFSDFYGCHFVIATHSPTLMSGSGTSRTSLVDLDGPIVETVQASARMSVDEILVRGFGVTNDGNLYVRRLLVESLRLVADRKTDSEAFASKLVELKNAARNLPSNSPVLKVVQDLDKAQFSIEGAED